MGQAAKEGLKVEPACFFPRPLSLESSLVAGGSRFKPPFVIKVVSGPDLDKGAVALVRQNVAVIIALGTAATIAASRASGTVPIVMVGVSDPVRLGLVASLARPGGNVTGVSFLAPELVQKNVELLLELIPKPSRIGILWNPDNPGAAMVLGAIQPSAEQLGIQLLPVQARTPTDVPDALTLAKTLGMQPLAALLASCERA